MSNFDVEQVDSMVQMNIERVDEVPKTNYPYWLTSEEHYKMCCKTSGDLFAKYGFNMGYYTPEDISNELYVWSLERLDKFDNHKLLKTAISNHYLDMMKRSIKDVSLIPYSLYTKNENEEDGFFENIECPDNELNKVELLETIKAVKNIKVKNYLIVAGYLLGNIAELEGMFKEVIATVDDETRSALNKIIERVIENDEINKCRCAEVRQRGLTLNKITSKTIAFAFGYKYRDVQKFLNLVRQSLSIGDQSVNYC